MIKKFSCQNFRNISASELEFAKINILIGPNNSGKSTVGKVLYSLIKTGILPITEYRNEINTTKANSFLKIAEGCDKHCTYCIIYYNSK